MFFSRRGREAIPARPVARRQDALHLVRHRSYPLGLSTNNEQFQKARQF